MFTNIYMMSTTKRTPTKNNKKIIITDLCVEFLASKLDDYDCVNCFFKIIDKRLIKIIPKHLRQQT